MFHKFSWTRAKRPTSFAEGNESITLPSLALVRLIFQFHLFLQSDTNEVVFDNAERYNGFSSSSTAHLKYYPQVTKSTAQDQ